MNSSYIAYRFLTACGAVSVVPLIWLHHRFRGEKFERFHQRMGHYPTSLHLGENTGRPRIWIHAVSVGEVGVAASICNALRRNHPGGAFFLSTLREQGLARAKELLGDSVPCFFAPLDLMGSTRRALETIRPDILVLLETEIWPNLIVSAHRMGVRLAIVNGRISVRSIKSYLKIRRLMAYTLAHVDAFSMISDGDARRIQSLGADQDRIAVHGNAKFDVPDPLKNPQAVQKLSELYAVVAGTPVIVAGSTRNPEELAILDAFVQLREKIPEALLIIVPRHIERAQQISQWVTERGLACQLRTRLGRSGETRNAPVVILDTIGELSATYGIADMVFCGGSLVPKGGQNIMEPAMWAKPIIFGPSMEDFADAKQMIASSGGGVLIENADQMADIAVQWLQSPTMARTVGLAARQAILPHGGAARKHAGVISRLAGAIGR